MLLLLQSEAFLEYGLTVITEGTVDAIAAHAHGIPCLAPVTTTFEISHIEELERLIERVVNLAESVGWEGQRIIEELEAGAVNRFRHSKIDHLEQYFEANGYLDARGTLDDEEIRLRVLEQYVGAGLTEQEASERTDRLLGRVSG